ncbi:MAG: GNAT family N-acetyltransferase [Brevinematia bacterium]
MNFIQINLSNIESEHICCAIGNDKINQKRAHTKKEWLKERFNEGLVFERLNERGKVFIEYMPIEKVWKPIIGKNYMVINCLWVSGQFKGKGFARELLNKCINDAKSKKMVGVAVVTSTKIKPLLTDKKFYLKHGFEVVDSAFPYFELLALKFDKNAENPHFTENAKSGKCKNKNGFCFVYSNQCPFIEEYVSMFDRICKSNNIPSEVIKLKSYKEAQEYGSPFGTLGVYYNGEFKTHEIMTEEKFLKFIETL